MISYSPSHNINELFDQYAKALVQFDAKKMVNFYHLPCIFMSDEASNLFKDASKLEGLFVQGTGFYKQFGLVKCAVDVVSKQFITEKICAVKANWRFYNSEEILMYSCDYQYVLKLDKKGQWKIEVSISVNEKDRMEKWLACKA